MAFIRCLAFRSTVPASPASRAFGGATVLPADTAMAPALSQSPTVAADTPPLGMKRR